MEGIARERHTRRIPINKKDLLSFWIFGLCNNYGYVVMLTAAMDIISSYEKRVAEGPSKTFNRECTPMSTGAILLADIIPSFVIKSLSPFLPYNTNYRVSISCVTSVFSFIVVAIADSRSVLILGVALTSFASGLGEPTFLAHSTHYNKNVVSTWSSGTGGAGIIGSLSYSLLRETGLSSRQTLLLMIFVPTLELLTFMFLLNEPITRNHETEDHEHHRIMAEVEEAVENPPLRTMAQKFSFIPELMIYFIPLTVVYFFEYFINQGLFELITFSDISLTKSEQYRWYQVTYQIGVFLSRSSVNIFQIRRTWIMAIIQGIIASFFFFEAIFLFIPTISVIFIIIFLEGFQGGLAYVNTYYRMSREIPPTRKEFAMNVVAASDSIGIILAGLIAIPAHNWICKMPGVSDL